MESGFLTLRCMIIYSKLTFDNHVNTVSKSSVQVFLFKTSKIVCKLYGFRKILLWVNLPTFKLWSDTLGKIVNSKRAKAIYNEGENKNKKNAVRFVKGIKKCNSV